MEEGTRRPEMKKVADRVSRFFLCMLRVKGSARMAMRETQVEFGFQKAVVYRWVNDFRRRQRFGILSKFNQRGEHGNPSDGEAGAGAS